MNSAIKEYSAKVVNRHGSLINVRDQKGHIHQCISPKKFKDVVCGDLVKCNILEQDRDQLIQLLPRKNQLLRKTEYATKLVASNLDLLIIICSVQPKPSLELIDQYLVAAENMPSSALIVLNKIDLDKNNETINTLKNKYKNLPYNIIQTTKENSSYINNLATAMQNKTCIFVGQSGVGKSTLANLIIPDIDIKTQEISEAIQKGKHTTSVTTLYTLPNGGELIDSPGVRDFKLPELDKDKILKGFYEISTLSSQCKFHNCIHISEPGCAVQKAIQNNSINKLRYASYKSMIEACL